MGLRKFYKNFLEPLFFAPKNAEVSDQRKEQREFAISAGLLGD